MFVKSAVIQLVREILHSSGISQGKLREFQKPLAVAKIMGKWASAVRARLILLTLLCFLAPAKSTRTASIASYPSSDLPPRDPK